MVKFILENFKMINFKVKENYKNPMEMFMIVNGIKVKFMEMEF